MGGFRGIGRIVYYGAISLARRCNGLDMTNKQLTKSDLESLYWILNNYLASGAAHSKYNAVYLRNKIKQIYGEKQ